MTACILCGAGAVRPVRDIPVADLVQGYRRFLGIEVGDCFHGTTLRYCHCPSCDLRFFDPPASGGAGFYKALSRIDWYYMNEKPEFEIARGYIHPGDRLLEIGGGRGGFAAGLDGVDYTGLEFNDEAVGAAAGRGVHMLAESLETHASRNHEGYDVVCAFQVLEHVPGPRGFLESALECLRPDGRLILSVPSHDSFMRSVPNPLLNMPPHHVTVWSDRALSRLAVLLGCSLERLVHEKLADYHYRWFLRTLLETVLGGRDRDDAPVLDLGRRARAKHFAAAAISTTLGFLTAPLFRRLPREFLPDGHSVLVVLRKPRGAEGMH